MNRKQKVWAALMGAALGFIFLIVGAVDGGASLWLMFLNIPALAVLWMGANCLQYVNKK